MADKGYDSVKLWARLKRCGIRLIVPHLETTSSVMSRHHFFCERLLLAQLRHLAPQPSHILLRRLPGDRAPWRAALLRPLPQLVRPFRTSACLS